MELEKNKGYYGLLRREREIGWTYVKGTLVNRCCVKDGKGHTKRGKRWKILYLLKDQRYGCLKKNALDGDSWRDGIRNLSYNFGRRFLNTR